MSLIFGDFTQVRFNPFIINFNQIILLEFNPIHCMYVQSVHFNAPKFIFTMGLFSSNENLFFIPVLFILALLLHNQSRFNPLKFNPVK